MNELTLEIFTPTGVVFKGKVTSVTVPGTKGSFTILKNHGAIISSLVKGKIRYIIDKEVTTINSSPGFVEMKDNVVTICLETMTQ